MLIKIFVIYFPIHIYGVDCHSLSFGYFKLSMVISVSFIFKIGSLCVSISVHYC